MTQGEQPADMTLRRSTRDPAWVCARLAAWLGSELDSGSDPVVTLHSAGDANGMSSDTFLISVTNGPQAGQAQEYAVRVAPRPQDVPVFPSYRLRDQYETMRLVRELSDVPVPRVGLFEESGSVLGTPFFLIDRVAGVIPPDVMPYNFGGNWLYDATPQQQQALQRRSIEVLVTLHAIPDAANVFAFLDPGTHGHEGATPLLRNLARTRAWYEFAVGRDGTGRSPLLERGLAWLASHPPRDEGEPVLVWGDGRVGNIVYRDFTPVAVLDWEMATLGPRAMDLGWMVFAHEVFEEIADTFGLPGMPDFLTAADATRTYTELSGVELDDLTWHRLHAAVQWGCVFLRTSARQIAFGEIERPADQEAVFHHRPLLERILAEVGA